MPSARVVRRIAIEIDLLQFRTAAEGRGRQVGEAGRQGDSRKILAGAKCVRTDALDIDSHDEVGQAAATRKSLVADADDTVANRGLAQAPIPFESIALNGEDAIRNLDAYHACALVKGEFADVCYAGRNRQASQLGTLIKGVISEIWQVRGHVDAVHRTASGKRANSQVGDAGGNADDGEIDLVREGPVPDGRHREAIDFGRYGHKPGGLTNAAGDQDRAIVGRVRKLRARREAQAQPEQPQREPAKPAALPPVRWSGRRLGPGYMPRAGACQRPWNMRAHSHE